ncbi:short-chain dehydrogenase [Mycolicibacterium madagascariense]|uniref:Short-chain dehydrogenase n=1 Tax=Mycolicibacterium madagascariense TaxID=212765 RepID=A0A7I7XAV7_9MYCO|nr:SDR family NAD(P)-dependent oxidoreductase [Mycolicibacterium madagascariense]MCV7011314.1 SDR family NAD(P)-dependent oxidoreductase [Mycolicibacterium madagascariense]BBZ26694.1 short-chain dehydrogenase [Mycolicibacterium madagascariense]
MSSILIIGASRGLGHAIAAEYLTRGWDVVGTVRAGSTGTDVHALAEANPGRVGIETVDINEPDQIAALRERLSGKEFGTLFVNAGTTTAEDTPIGEVSTEDFVTVMVTNALSPMRVIDALADLVSPAGLIGVMSSGQGSITNNTNGLREVYRASKAALNMLMRSLAARHADTERAFVLMAPGWIRTALGGDDAPFTIEETIPAVVDVLIAKRERPGLEYLDRFGKTVPW